MRLDDHGADFVVTSPEEAVVGRVDGRGGSSTRPRCGSTDIACSTPHAIAFTTGPANAQGCWQQTIHTTAELIS
jgi:hypothetical protein